MQTRNKMLDDISQLMTNAMGVAQGAREEAETAVKSVIDRWLADQDFVTREEFDAVRSMAQKAREENAALSARIEALEKPKSSFWLSCAALIRRQTDSGCILLSKRVRLLSCETVKLSGEFADLHRLAGMFAILSLKQCKNHKA